MPRGDRTGPEGRGPKTGRGLGDCPSSARRTPSRFRPGRGRGLGRGLGLGRRRR